MAELKTKVNDAPVADFLAAIEDSQVREDCRTIADLMQRATKSSPQMWGSSIVGFGRHRTVYAGGREADWMLIGFAPRKQNIALYGMKGSDQSDELISRLGKCSTGKGCLYIKRLADVDVTILKKLVKASVQGRMGQ